MISHAMLEKLFYHPVALSTFQMVLSSYQKITSYSIDYTNIEANNILWLQAM